jgi:APA family basic amino acid/polyamine antiporter
VTLQNAVVGGKLVLIAAFVLVGLWLAPTRGLGEHALPGNTDVFAFAVTLVWVSFAYSGWNAAVYVGGKVRDPERNLRRSLLLGTGIITVAYLALNTVFLYSAPAAAVAGRADVAAIAALALGGTGMHRAVSALVAVALFTSISSMVMAGPRVYARMAEDGLLPGFFAVSRDVPSAAIAAQVLLALLVLWVSTLAELLSYIGFVLSLSTAATVAGLVALRRREGAASVPIPGYPWIPGLYVTVTVAAALFMAVREPFEAAVGVLSTAAGLPLYWILRRTRAKGDAGRGRHRR